VVPEPNSFVFMLIGAILVTARYSRPAEGSLHPVLHRSTPKA
jgi:hypothetical protein